MNFRLCYYNILNLSHFIMCFSCIFNNLLLKKQNPLPAQLAHFIMSSCNRNLRAKGGKFKTDLAIHSMAYFQKHIYNSNILPQPVIE